MTRLLGIVGAPDKGAGNFMDVDQDPAAGDEEEGELEEGEDDEEPDDEDSSEESDE